LSLQLFFLNDIPGVGISVELPAETARHLIAVLRMRDGDKLALTNGKGSIAEAAIISTSKKSCSVTILSSVIMDPPECKITLCISVLKNANRFEWMLEKVTEIGATTIIPLICERTERQHFRLDRMQSIVMSAMLQSQQAWLPEIMEPVVFQKAVGRFNADKKFIAHCIPGDKTHIISIPPSLNNIILIGPEGDFTPGEIDLALAYDYTPVSLGNNRLRTETAGVVAVSMLAANQFSQ
jgi:16S rRNA (uracil1498-N3)-methyltransferase